jgi:hypothetical protein
MFADPRSGVERRAKRPRAVERDDEKRRYRDRRVFSQSRNAKPWWLMRGYVTEERFFGTRRLG